MDGQFYVDTRAPHMMADQASVTLSTTALPIFPNAALPVLGSSYFGWVGKAVRMRIWGQMTTGATPGNLTVGMYWGNNTGANGTILSQSAAVALTASASNAQFEMDWLVRCRAIGATGALLAHGMFNSNVILVASTLQPIMIPPQGAAQTTCDLTQNNFLSPQIWRSGSTAESVIVHDMTFEALN